MSIQVDEVTYRYGRLTALERVSATAALGRITVVLGPNAAGKSTLLRCVIGALRPGQGRVLIDGRPVRRLRPRRLATHLAYVPQRSTVSAAFTVREVVELGRYALPPSRRRIDEALDRLQLTELAERRYPALSVGQQQRVTLARCVAQLEPDGHLVLDEPMSAMDLRHVRHTSRLLRELADGGRTILLAMHDLTLAAALADEVWLMRAGRLVGEGPTPEVMSTERLEAAFDVPFRWITDGGREILLSAP